jgi:hypothetical protein
MTIASPKSLHFPSVLHLSLMYRPVSTWGRHTCCYNSGQASWELGICQLITSCIYSIIAAVGWPCLDRVNALPPTPSCRAHGVWAAGLLWKLDRIPWSRTHDHTVTQELDSKERVSGSGAVLHGVTWPSPGMRRSPHGREAKRQYGSLLQRQSGARPRWCHVAGWEPAPQYGNTILCVGLHGVTRAQHIDEVGPEVNIGSRQSVDSFFQLGLVEYLGVLVSHVPTNLELGLFS